MQIWSQKIYSDYFRKNHNIKILHQNIYYKVSQGLIITLNLMIHPYILYYE